MTFPTRRFGRPTMSGPHSRSTAPIDNQPLIACCRHLAFRVLAYEQSRDQAREQALSLTGNPQVAAVVLDKAALEADDTLHRDLTAVGLQFDRLLADPRAAGALHAGDKPWPVIAPQLLDLLLVAAGSALATDPSLTGLIADTVLLTRRGSRAAWRLRALAHEQWGDLHSAVQAHQEYLARTDIDKLGVGAVVSTLGELRDARVALAAALIDAHDDGAVLPMPSAADLHDLLSRPVRQEALDLALEEFLGELTRLPTAELEAVRNVQEAVAHCLRTSLRSSSGSPT
ncbi:MAG TPA: hypothetical protein VLL08_31135 [Kineosporiaceae bacterium]|nr:hypothetical protein [Kineosporiaceae bacterium]